MADLKTLLANAGFKNVQTYIQSGNVILQSDLDTENTAKAIETLLAEKFESNTTSIKVLALNKEVYHSIIEEAQKHFGDTTEAPDYRFDVLFLIAISAEEAMKEIETRDNIDTAWQGTHAIYYRRPGPSHPDYTKSALSRLAKKKMYQSITIRNWKTTLKMWALLTT